MLVKAENQLAVNHAEDLIGINAFKLLRLM